MKYYIERYKSEIIFFDKGISDCFVGWNGLVDISPEELGLGGKLIGLGRFDRIRQFPYEG